MKHTRWIMCGLLLLLTTSCGIGGGKSPPPPYPGIKIGRPYEIYGRWYEPQYDAHYDETGTASWYGPGFHGGHTANGETYDQYSLTAAHRTLPMPSIVRVTNLENGKSTLVKVNDRGPFAHDRIIDLSKAAAAKLGMIGHGTAQVRVQFLERETKQYVQNMQSGTQYAMSEMKHVNPEEAGAHEEAGAQPELRIESRMFADEDSPPLPAPQPTRAQYDTFAALNGAPAPAAYQAPKHSNPFALVDDANAAELPSSQHPVASYNTSGGIVSLANHGFFVQAGTFGMSENAHKLLARISSYGKSQVMEIADEEKTFYRVMMGPYEQQQDAKNILSKLSTLGIADAKIVRN